MIIYGWCDDDSDDDDGIEVLVQYPSTEDRRILIRVIQAGNWCYVTLTHKQWQEMVATIERGILRSIPPVKEAHTAPEGAK